MRLWAGSLWMAGGASVAKLAQSSAMTTDPPPSLDVRRPFTTPQALAAKLTRKALRSRRYHRIFHGVFIDARVKITFLLRIEAALLVHPAHAFASHAAAARLYEAPIPEHLHDVDIGVYHQRERHRRRGIRCHVLGKDTALTTVRGFRCTTPEQTFIDLGTVLDLVALVVVGDFLVRTGRTTPQALIDAAAHSSRDGCVLARRAAGYVRKHVDSPMETRLRMLLVLAGLPEPKVNFKVYYADGRVRYRFDLSYPGLKLIVEYDGRQHREDLEQWDRDNDRGDWFDSNGWRIVKVFSHGIYKDPEKTIHRVCDALRSRGCPDLPRVLSEEWREYFPGKVTSPTYAQIATAPPEDAA